MKLIVGLGNPGRKYSQTRHNVGFMVIDTFLKNLQLKTKFDAKLNGEICLTTINQEKTMFLKPSTFMNLSGDSIYKAVQYYQIQLEDIVIIVDDVNLTTGKLRLRELGGHGGHNGLRHIIALLKSEQLKRIRIGIGYENNMPLDRFVLGKFDEDDLSLIQKAIVESVEAISLFLNNKPFVDIMTKYNTQT